MAPQRREEIAETALILTTQAARKGTTPRETSTAGKVIKPAGIAVTEVRPRTTTAEWGHWPPPVWTDLAAE
jgi:hypothetical protein